MSVTSFLEAMGFFKSRFSTTAMLFLLRLLGSASAASDAHGQNGAGYHPGRYAEIVPVVDRIVGFIDAGREETGDKLRFQSV